MKIEKEDQTWIIFLDGRIDTNNAGVVEKEIFSALEGRNPDEGEVMVDAKELEYISSAGLRVLMKLRKHIGKPLVVRNVSRDVYDIFEMTGFTELFDVKKALRKVSVAGCEVIGAGGHGKVYQLDAETILKVYHDNSPLSLIEREREYAKNAFLQGVPSAIAYDVVECEEGYGVVFEMAGATTLSRMIMEHPDRLPEFAVKFGNLLKLLNQTEADPELYGDIRSIYMERAEKAGHYFTGEENAQIKKMLQSIPDGRGMVHGDYHPNNVMVQADGELILIDMADISRGNELFDVGGTFLTMYLSGMKDPEITLQTIGIDYESAKQVWGIFLSTYYGTSDEKRLEMISKRCGAFGLLRMANTLGFESERTKAHAPAIVELLRQNLFPNTDSFCTLLGMTV